MLRTVTPREERVLRLRFGLEGEPHTLEQLGQQCGKSREQMRRIEDKALRKLRHPTRCQKLRYAAHAIGLAGGAFERWPIPEPGSKAWEAGVRPPRPCWWEVNGKQQPSLERIELVPVMPEPLPQPDAIEVQALTQGMPVERFDDILTPRATAPIGEVENLARRLRLPRERLDGARLVIPPHDEPLQMRRSP